MLVSRNRELSETLPAPKTCSQRAQKQSQRPQVPCPLLAGILAHRDLPLQQGLTSATPVTKTKTSFHSSVKSKVSLLGEVDRTERRKCTKFTRRSQTSRKSTKRVRDFSGKESIRDCGEGDWVQKIPCQWTPPPPSGIVLSMI